MRSLAVFFIFISLHIAVFASEQTKSPSPLFQDRQTIDIKIEAPFDLLWRLIALEGYNPQTIKKIYVPAKIYFNDSFAKEKSLKLMLRARGETSPNRDSECTFPKLKLKFDSVKDSLFDHAQTVNLATHCGELDEGTFTSLGRAAHQEGTKREFFYYDFLDRMGHVVPKVRLARITYIDVDTGDEITRYGFFLEDFENLAKRMDAELLDFNAKQIRVKALKNHQLSAKGIENVSPLDLSRFYMSEYMALNYDWGYEYHHNVEILRKKDSSEIPIAYDFDLAEMANAPLPMPEDSTSEIDPHYFDTLNYQIDDLRRTLDTSSFLSIEKRFLQIYDEQLSIIKSSDMSVFSMRHLGGFMKNIKLALASPE